MPKRPRTAAATVLFALLSVTPAPAARQPSTAEPPRDEYLEACRPNVLAKVDDEATRLGVPGGVAEAELDPLPTRQRKGDRTEVAGGGRFRLGPAYDWQPMTWTCRYDEKDGEVDRAGFRGDTRAALASLPPPQQQALARCRRAVAALIGEQASRRRWRTTQYSMSTGSAAAFGERDGRPQVMGVGEFTAKVSYGADVGMQYTCTFDPDVDGAIDAEVALARSPFTIDGQLAENRYETLTCSSSDYREQRCTTSRAIAGNVRVKNQYSKNSCAGRFRWDTWAIIVWDGCRAEFEFEVR